MSAAALASVDVTRLNVRLCSTANNQAADPRASPGLSLGPRRASELVPCRPTPATNNYTLPPSSGMFVGALCALAGVLTIALPGESIN